MVVQSEEYEEIAERCVVVGTLAVDGAWVFVCRLSRLSNLYAF